MPMFTNGDKYSIIRDLYCSGSISGGGRTLLISREQYLRYYDRLKEGKIPLTLWVNISIQVSEGETTMWTYGMKDFGFKEIEIIKASMNMEDLFVFLHSICCYVLEYNLTFKDGDTFEYATEQKVNIGISKGVNLEGLTIKLKL